MRRVLVSVAWRLGSDSGQSSWLATGFKIAFTLAMAGAAYKLITGPYSGLLQQAQTMFQELTARIGQLP